MSRVVGLLVAALIGAPWTTGAAEPGGVASFLKRHCASCHESNAKADGAKGNDPTDAATGAFDLTRLSADLADADSLRAHVRIHDRVAAHEMPPKDAPQPSADEKRSFLAALAGELTRADRDRRRGGPRRLNRVEYENTLRDLFGIRVDLKEMLPVDPTAHGFDTVGDVLAISPEQMEIYLQAADKALDQVFGADKPPKTVRASMPLGRDPFPARNIGQLFVKQDDDSLVTFQGHWCPTVFHAGRAHVEGTYRVKIKARTHQTDKPLVMAVYGGDVIVGRQPSHLVGYFDVKPGDEWTEVAFDDWLEPYGCFQMKPYALSAPTQGPKRFEGPGLRLGEISVEGPLEAWPPTSRAALLGKADPKTATLDDACEILTRLLPRAFRRPTQPADAAPYVRLTQQALDQKRPFVDALRVGLKAILCSPEFLLRDEPTLEASVADDGAKSESRRDAPAPVSDHALASRLSYFLWSSMPDDELRQLAETGRLNATSKDTENRTRRSDDPKSGARSPFLPLAHSPTLDAQLERMLNDPKADRFVKNFTGQWLKLREIDFTEPDARQYPEFDEMLRHAMVEETHRFFREILDHDRPLLEFIDSDWTILNERLAKHYGIEGVSGQPFRRVALPKDSPRGGVLTQASVLKVTANGTNTSPVVRGVWVLDQILGRPVPPPPPGVPAIEPDIRGATTVREQLDRHRTVASCAACHHRIDPPGFALECFDAIGGHRTWYRSLGKGEPVNLSFGFRRVEYKKGPNVDPSGRMPDGKPFADVREFKRLLLEDKDQLARALTEKLLTYGLGRGLGFSDRPAVEAIVANVRKKNYGFRALLHEVVQSEPFRTR